MFKSALCVLAIACASVASAEPRKWVLTQGAPVIGEYISADNGAVIVRTASGEERSLSVPGLSDGDQAFVAQKRGYAVVEVEYVRGAKAALTVRLPERVTSLRLTQMANELHSFPVNQEPRLFISYYLPGMKIGEGSWASTHFTPALEVKILGTTKAQNDALSNQLKSPVSVDAIGRWAASDKLPFPGIITIFRQNGVLFKTQKFADGSEGRYQLLTRTVGGQVRYIEKGSNTSDYVVILPNGDLAHGDEDGIWTTSKRAR